MNSRSSFTDRVFRRIRNNRYNYHYTANSHGDYWSFMVDVV